MERELPYDFDLLYDVKTYEQIERIANYEGDCSEASPEDLVDLFQQLKMKVPKCLASFAPRITIWVLPDGSWLPYEPLEHEEPEARKVKLKGWS